MPRNITHRENKMRATAKRDSALARNEFRYPSEPRKAAASATSFPVKAVDPTARALIDEFLAKNGPRR